jgi:hypothetical protein
VSAYLKVVLDYFIFHIILLLKHNRDVSPENPCIEFANLVPVPGMCMSEIMHYIKINIGNLKQNTEVSNSSDLCMKCC